MAKTPEIDLRDNPLQNYIMNGDMRISQRGTSFVALADGGRTVDRFRYSKNGVVVHTASQDTDVPTLLQAGQLFQNSLRMNLTTPDTAIAAGDYAFIHQSIEGYDFAQIAQKVFTLSFWVKATLAGTYCVAFQNHGQDRSYVAEYTIDASNVWEKKSITVTASPSGGTWDYANGRGLSIRFTLAAGSTFQTTANAWQTGNFFGTANQVNGINTGATDFRMTGVMLNVGAQAQDFSLMSKTYAREFASCQRYAEMFNYTSTLNSGPIGQATSTTSVSFTPQRFCVEKRAAPTISLFSGSNYVLTAPGGNGGGTPSYNGFVTTDSFVINVGNASGLVAGNAATLYGTFTLLADAEL